MANIIIPPGWKIPESIASTHSGYQNRREFVKTLGLGTMALASTTLACQSTGASAKPDGPLDTIPAEAPRDGLPAPRAERFTVPERLVTERLMASSYTNFYEFINQGNLKRVWPLTDAYKPFPWTIQVRGLVEDRKLNLDVADLIRTIGLEERLYRFRCVEAWSMIIPWTGFPLARLIALCKPRNEANFVKFTCVERRNELPGQATATWYPWPYFEALRMNEALNELAFVATGMYGEPLPKQNGSPLRLVLPWKYGYKGPKAVTRIEFTKRQPDTFWNKLQPREYGFLSNVNPYIPHPRWSQAAERFLPREGVEEPLPTKIFNGYDEWVAELYPDEPREHAGPIIR